MSVDRAYWRWTPKIQQPDLEICIAAATPAAAESRTGTRTRGWNDTFPRWIVRLVSVDLMPIKNAQDSRFRLRLHLLRHVCSLSEPIFQWELHRELCLSA